jgi:membrane-bound lytic murein transglycosylase B
MAAAGGRALGGGALAGPDASLVRAGKRRFLVHANYEARLHYNCAHHYALGGGLLAEGIALSDSTP